MPGALDALAPHLTPGVLVTDVCSVKTAPVRWMREKLPEHVEIVGTHPMFGPQSAPESLERQRIVVCPERTERLDSIRGFLDRLGLHVLVTDAETHDRECAYTQALAQYVGRALSGIDGEDSRIRTPASGLLREVSRIVGSDSWELFAAIETLNPYAADMRREVRRRFERLDARLAAGAEA